jgi:hypothetical protein
MVHPIPCMLSTLLHHSGLGEVHGALWGDLYGHAYLARGVLLWLEGIGDREGQVMHDGHPYGAELCHKSQRETFIAQRRVSERQSLTTICNATKDCTPVKHVTTL